MARVFVSLFWYWTALRVPPPLPLTVWHSTKGEGPNLFIGTDILGFEKQGGFERLILFK